MLNSLYMKNTLYKTNKIGEQWYCNRYQIFQTASSKAYDNNDMIIIAIILIKTIKLCSRNWNYQHVDVKLDEGIGSPDGTIKEVS